MPSTVMIQTAGTKTAKRPGIRGANPPPNAVVLNAKPLKNPYGKLANYTQHRHLDKVKAFLLDEDPGKVATLVRKGCAAINAQKPVVVVCLFGRDRSRAIAELIGDNFHPSRVYYAHREVWGEC